jgi:hypothetical protein
MWGVVGGRSLPTTPHAPSIEMIRYYARSSNLGIGIACGIIAIYVPLIRGVDNTPHPLKPAQDYSTTDDGLL